MSTVNISRGGLVFGIQCFVTNRHGSQINQDQASQRRGSVRNVTSNRHYVQCCQSVPQTFRRPSRKRPFVCQLAFASCMREQLQAGKRESSGIGSKGEAPASSSDAGASSASLGGWTDQDPRVSSRFWHVKEKQITTDT